MLERVQQGLALLVGAFVFWTAATGPFEGLVQRAIFLALVAALGFALYPLGRGTRWRPLGLAVDLFLTAAACAACAYVVWNYETIMGSLPWATNLDMVLTGIVRLMVSRRPVSSLGC